MDDPDLTYPLRSDSLGKSWTISGNHLLGFVDVYDLRMVRQPAAEPTRYDPATLEPFDRARAEAGEQVFDWRGNPVFGLRYDLRGLYAIGGFTQDENVDVPNVFRPQDLRMAPKPQRPPKRWWIRSCVARNGQRYCEPRMFESEEAARANSHDNDDVSFTDIPE